MDNRTLIAKRVAKEFTDGDFVNLGIGMPTLVADHLPPGISITLHSENGVAGIGAVVGEEHPQFNPNLVNASGTPSCIVSGAAVFDSALSFVLIRGGHLDATVLGALEVDQEGNLANWIVPGKLVPGMGGAMDLVSGAKRVIIAMEHTGKDGSPKILKKCTLPLTAVKVVDMIVTNLCVFEITSEGMVLTELAPGVSEMTVRNATSADYTISPRLKEMSFDY